MKVIIELNDRISLDNECPDGEILIIFKKNNLVGRDNDLCAIVNIDDLKAALRTMTAQ